MTSAPADLETARNELRAVGEALQRRHHDTTTSVVEMIRALPPDHELDPGRGDVANRLENLLTVKENPMLTDPTARAHAAYQAYGASTGGLNHLGKPMPAWNDLPDTIRTAWAAAATAAVQHTAPDFPATLAGGHALVLQYGDCEIHAACQCGEPLGTSTPAQPLDTHAPAWERHVMSL
ncbi:hypothetical protein [Kitasatospora sp. NPDC058478]|uniref:hypothetical protein n=1 Tax=unclassified Kitasatospora TaxID=2633591 RepID=UPI00365C4F9F